jgi:CotH kinase protein/Concanavalin A-like lectin/glucanases superfamily/Lamin Tail Domain
MVKSSLFWSALIIFLVFCRISRAQVRITEFMASNTHTLADEDGDFSDWIEIQNTSASSVNLFNWALTDSAGNPAKWLFPSTNIAPGGFMIIFASGKDRRIAGQELHTNFKLSADGEYLALFRPDLTVATELSPNFPPQFPDVSYGLTTEIQTTTLVTSNASIHYLIPTNASAADATWNQTDFDDSSWQTGINGIGYETGMVDPQEESYAAKVLAAQPVAYWRLNETNGPEAVNAGTEGVEDEAGYQGNIVFGGAGPRPPQFPTFETNNFAPTFDGSSAFVNGPYELVNDLPAFTIAGWVNPSATPSSRTGLFGQNDTMEFGFNSPSTIQIWTPVGSVSANYPFPNNQWHYVMAVGGDGQLALYLDGNLAGSTSVSAANFGESEYNFNIGGGGIFDPTGNYFKGQIDEVAVWYRALSTNEINTLLATSAEQVDYTPYINTDVRAQMYGSNSTAYVRIPFIVTDPSVFDTLQLLVRYDDGFEAYLNGHEIASANAPVPPAWNSTATQRHLDPQAVQWQAFDVSAAQSYLQAGDNVLAIQALNIAATNTDFLMQAQLLAETITNSEEAWRYFTVPTPGGPNGTSTNDLGPIMTGAGHFPDIPQVGDSLTVTAQVAQAFNPISNVTLHYRAMFNAEVTAPMNDSGTNGDAMAADGIWTGIIPSGVATTGQLVRYYVTSTDSDGNSSRWPIFPDPTESQQYLGTVVADPSIQSQLPVAYLFIQNPSDADNQTGTQASLFYLGELYDNLHIYVHGQSSIGWPKKSHNLDFPKDHQFLYQPNGAREKKIIFMSNYGDKARMRTTLTYAAIARSGGVGFFSFPIRIQLNGSFWGVEDMVEHGDENFLDRIGRDDDGALYKMYNNMSTASGNEKKTRDWEGTADLTALIANLDESIPLTNRVTYAYDNLDLPQTASYFADMALTSDQDVGHKNYYLYRDSDGTGEWAIFPWDVDLSWGRDWLDSQGYFTDTIFTNNVLDFYNLTEQSKPSNRLFDLFFDSGDFRQMYLRRLRTLMDTILMPPGTPTNALVIEPLIRQYENTLNPSGISPSDTALDYAAWGPTWGDTSLSQFPNDAERIISIYLPGRRDFLFNSPSATLNGDLIPSAQPTNAVILIGSWDYNPVSGNQNEQYVELRNTNSYAVDVSNWRLTGSIAFTLRPGTVIPAGKSLYIAADINAFRARAVSPHAGQNIFVQGPFAGFLSTQGNSPLILENDKGALVSENSFAGSSTSTQFVAGNLAVLRAGDGTESLSSHGNSIFIDQFTTNGALVGTIAIPDNATNALLVSGSASSEGALTRSADGRLLVFAGYNIALTNSASSLANASATNVPRALGIVDMAGNFAIVGLTTNQYGGNNIRSGTTDGHGNYWGAGANSGTFYFGDGLTNTIQNIVANTLAIQDLGGNLYFSTSKTTPGIWKVPGMPTTPTSPNLFLGAGSSSSPFAFAFNTNFTVAYVADDSLAGNGGVQRWDFDGGVWTMRYAFAGLTNIGARGLAVDFSGTNPVIYATTAEDAANRLVSLTDTGPTANVTTLATAGVNQLFRGVAWTPNAAVNPGFYAQLNNTNGFMIAWTALLNRNYTVQYIGDLTRTDWITLTNLTATLPVVSVTDTTAPANTNRFYRVILNP